MKNSMATVQPETKNNFEPDVTQEEQLSPSVTTPDQRSLLSGWRELSIFSKYSWYVLLYNLLVVAWGVYVRAAKDGDGCGSHWPLCDGNSDPMNGPVARIVEASHRISTSLVGVLAIILVVWAYRAYPRKSLTRKASVAAFGFTLLEGLIGEILVKYKLVTMNPSAWRAVVMGIHTVSTFMLLGSFVVAAYAGSGRGFAWLRKSDPRFLKEPRGLKIQWRNQGAIGWMIGLAYAMVIGLGVTGAISALGHQLDPVSNVLKAASDPTTFWMVRVQPYHPFLSLAVWMYFVLMASLIVNLRPSGRIRKAAIVMLATLTVEILIGVMNIELKAPIWVQMTHLAFADCTVMSLIWFTLTVLEPAIPHNEQDDTVIEKVSKRELLKQYTLLTKPRVISLLSFTQLAAMFAAKGGWPGFTLVVTTFVGGYLMAGSANAFNMVVERDLDKAMSRTRVRPTVTSVIPGQRALGFALILMVVAFAILLVFGNLLAACLAMAGLVFYVCIYTLGLKRRTWQNIVIGGAAGAFPPLVGWASVTGNLSALSYYLFAIIFLWTPVHFWALAILIKDEYFAAGVPMLPVVKGLKVTAKQICFYMALTAVVSLVPFEVQLVGKPYLFSALVLNAALGWLCIRLLMNPARLQASRLFHFSMIYLALLFLAVATDRAIASPTRVQAPSQVQTRVLLTGFRGNALGALNPVRSRASAQGFSLAKPSVTLADVFATWGN